MTSFPGCATMCERFIAEEKEMADFFYEHLPKVTRQYLRRQVS